MKRIIFVLHKKLCIKDRFCLSHSMKKEGVSVSFESTGKMPVSLCMDHETLICTDDPVYYALIKKEGGEY